MADTLPTIERTRGDTVPDVIRLNAGVAGFVFQLTVNSEQNPTDTNQQILQMAGEIKDSINGIVEFRPSLAESRALVPGTYFYDYEIVIPRSGLDDDVKTLEKGIYVIEQDITKES